MFYSKTTGGFYDAKIHGTQIPADAVEITDDEYKTLLIAQSSGKRISANASGKPVARNPDPPSLDDAKVAKLSDLKLKTQNEIGAGFESSALGSAHLYPSSQTDQINLNALLIESLLPGSADEYKFWCSDKDGKWKRRLHTKLQLQQVGLDMLNHVKKKQSEYEKKSSDVDLATSVNEIETI